MPGKKKAKKAKKAKEKTLLVNENRLRDACINNDPEKVGVLLQCHTNPNAQDEVSNSSIVVAMLIIFNCSIVA